MDGSKLWETCTWKSLIMAKSDLWKEDIITIVLVLSLVAFDLLKREWKELEKEGFNWRIVKKSNNPHNQGGIH